MRIDCSLVGNDVAAYLPWSCGAGMESSDAQFGWTAHLVARKPQSRPPRRPVARHLGQNIFLER